MLEFQPRVRKSIPLSFHPPSILVSHFVVFILLLCPVAKTGSNVVPGREKSKYGCQTGLRTR